MMRQKRNKRGLTPIIAVILLLMMTVAAAGAAFFWFIRIQGELQGGSESYSNDLADKISSSVDVIVAEYSGSNQLDLYLKNNGNTDIPIARGSTQPTTTWILSDANQRVICSTYWGSSSGDATYCSTGCADTLQVGELQKVSLILDSSGGTDCTISSASTYPNGTAFYYVMDFSGQAASGGRFVKD